MQTPQRSESLLSFAGRLSPCPLRSVPVYPKSWARIGNCIPNVRKLISRKKGIMLLGWRFWEWPDVFMEAEFHAVWQMPDGGLQDPTPNEWGEPKIRFVELLAAPLPLDGAYPDNIIEQLSDHGLVARFIDALREQNMAKSKGLIPELLNAQAKANNLYAEVSKAFGEEPRLSEKLKTFTHGFS